MAIGDERKYPNKQPTNLAGTPYCNCLRCTRLILDNKFTRDTVHDWFWVFNNWNNFGVCGLSAHTIQKSRDRRRTLDQSNSYSKWIVEITAGNKVEIPTNVKGNEVLFDVFNNLKGFRTEKMLEALSSSESIKTVLWQK